MPCGPADLRRACSAGARLFLLRRPSAGFAVASRSWPGAGCVAGPLSGHCPDHCPAIVRPTVAPANVRWPDTYGAAWPAIGRPDMPKVPTPTRVRHTHREPRASFASSAGCCSASPLSLRSVLFSRPSVVTPRCSAPIAAAASAASCFSAGCALSSSGFCPGRRLILFRRLRDRGASVPLTSFRVPSLLASACPRVRPLAGPVSGHWPARWPAIHRLATSSITPRVAGHWPARWPAISIGFGTARPGRMSGHWPATCPAIGRPLPCSQLVWSRCVLAASGTRLRASSRTLDGRPLAGPLSGHWPAHLSPADLRSGAHSGNDAPRRHNVPIAFAGGAFPPPGGRAGNPSRRPPLLADFRLTLGSAVIVLLRRHGARRAGGICSCRLPRGRQADQDHFSVFDPDHFLKKR